MITEDWWYETDRKSEILGEIVLTVTMYPPQIPHGLLNSAARRQQPPDTGHGRAGNEKQGKTKR
jgi:hypothetical protein